MPNCSNCRRPATDNEGAVSISAIVGQRTDAGDAAWCNAVVRVIPARGQQESFMYIGGGALLLIILLLVFVF